MAEALGIADRLEDQLGSWGSRMLSWSQSV